MLPHRRRIAFLILVIIVVGQAIDIVFHREDWPFSNYPMYARLIRNKETSLLRLYGRMADGRVIPIVSDDGRTLVPPVNELRMKNILEYAWSTGKAAATQRVLRDYMAMYDERRRLGKLGTQAPATRMIEAICMQITWKLDVKRGKISEPSLQQLASASSDVPLPSDDPPSTATRPSSISKVAR